MKIQIDNYLTTCFKPWAGAKEVFARLEDDELDFIEEILDEDERQWTEIEINDLFWFDTGTILEILDLDEEEFWKRERIRQDIIYTKPF